MTRTCIAIWMTFAVVCHALLGGGGQLVCVSYGDDSCGVVQVDSCCGEPLDQDCPPSPGGDECCVDVLPSPAAETVAPRTLSTRDADLVMNSGIPSAMLAIPPPSGDASARHRRYTFRSGPPRDTSAVVRTSRLLL